MSKKVIIRADASPQIGTGHIMRCLALSHGFKENGWETIFVTYCESEEILKRIKDEGYKVHLLQKPDDRDGALLIIADEKPQWVVLDGYHFDTDYQKTIKNHGYKDLVIDDYAHLDRYYADIILNQNFGSEKLNYNTAPNTKMLIGTKYVLLRNEFMQYSDYKREWPDVAKKILLTMGGADPDNYTLKVVKALNLIDISLEVKIVVGVSNPHYESIRTEAGNSRHRMEILQNVHNMAQLMQWADVATSAGGTTLWELSFMGLPSLTCIVTDNQKDAVIALSEAKMHQTIKWIRNCSVQEISDSLKNLMNNRTIREKMSKDTRSLVDGKGVKRILGAMMNKGMRILFLGSKDTNGLSEWLETIGEEVYFTDRKVNSDFVRKYNPDIIISYNYRYILKKDIIDIPPKGVINLHISYLPWNKGAHPNVWSIIDNTQKGVTIHYMDEGIDSGDILLQKEVYIDEKKETLRSSYEKLHGEIQRLFKTNWFRISSGEINPVKQSQEGTLHYKREDQLFSQIIRDRGWDIVISEFKELMSQRV